MMFWATFLAFHVSVFFAVTHAWACSQRLLFEDKEWCITQFASDGRAVEEDAAPPLRYVQLHKTDSSIELIVGDYGEGHKGIKLQLSGLEGRFAELLVRKGVAFDFSEPCQMYTVPQELCLMETGGLGQGQWTLFWQVCTEAEILPAGLKKYLEDLFLAQQWGRGALSE
ncbi:MAG: hypothetical protein LCH26_03265 [Proteobacteria bacterium]|nr:hypothetical protein [Pseudomonadota bacterium]